MFKFVVTTLLLLTSGLFIAARGQDQTVTISVTPTVLKDDLTDLLDSKKASIKTDSSGGDTNGTNLYHACQLIRIALGQRKSDQSTCSLGDLPAEDKATDYIIHVLWYKDSASQTSQVAVEQENWYVYNESWDGATTLLDYLKDPRVKDHFKETRIFGDSRVAMVYVHQNVPGTDLTRVTRQQIADAVKQQWTPEDTKNLQSALDKANSHFEDLLADFRDRNKPPPCAGFDPSDALVSSDLTNLQLGDLAKDNFVSKLAGLCEQFEVGALWAQASQGSHNYDQYGLATPSSQHFVPLSGSAAADDRYLPINYKVKISQKTPQPLFDLQSIAKLVIQGKLGAQGAVRTLNVTVPVSLTLAGGQAFDVKPLPSDMEVDALVGGPVQGSGATTPAAAAQPAQPAQPVQISKQTYDNEKKYRYGFSFALPFNTFKELQSTVQSGSVSDKLVQRQNLFAMVNGSFIPWDTKKPQAQLIPIFMYGLPISGKPLDRHLFAVAVGLNKVQVFAGLLEERTLTSTGTSGALASRVRWVGKLAYGVNLPVADVVNVLKGSSAKAKK